MNLLLNPIPLPEPVEEVRFEQDYSNDQIEILFLRSGNMFVKWPYTITDCYEVRYISTGFLKYKAITVISSEKLERKRREMFEHAYNELIRGLNGA
jgi:hypothetical protein